MAKVFIYLHKGMHNGSVDTVPKYCGTAVRAVALKNIFYEVNQF